MWNRLKRKFLEAGRLASQAALYLPSEERRLYREFARLRDRFFEGYWREVADELGVELDPLGYGFYRLRRGRTATFVRRGEVMLDDHLTLDIAGNKPLVHRLLLEQGCRVPEYLEYEFGELDKARDFMRRQAGDCVVKPASGAAGGRGITTKIDSPARLRAASWQAARHSSNGRLIIEQEQPGANYRLLYLDGRFLDAIRRDAPCVVGDGQGSIRALLRDENLRRLRAQPVRALSPLLLDLDARYSLARQGLGPGHVPAAGDRVRVKTATNQNGRAENRSVRDQMHPSIVDFGRRISEIIPVRLSGVDMMINDHRLPLEQSGCVVNEINTTPGLHHHALVAGAATEVKVGVLVLDYLLTQRQKRELLSHVG